MQSRFSLDQCHADIEAFYTQVCAANVIPLSVGGDHSITYSILKAVGRERPVGMVHIDAHCDTSGEYEGAKFHHGGPFRQAVLAGVLDPERSIQIGIRGGAEYLWEFSYDSGMTVLHDEDVTAMGIPAVVAKAREVVGDGPVYVTFDVDGVDPGFRARHRHAGSRRADAARGARHPARTGRPRRRRRRRGRGRAAVRRDDQHRADRRAGPVRAAVPRRHPSPAAARSGGRGGRAMSSDPRLWGARFRAPPDPALMRLSRAESQLFPPRAVRHRLVAGARARAVARRHPDRGRNRRDRRRAGRDRGRVPVGDAGALRGRRGRAHLHRARAHRAARAARRQAARRPLAQRPGGQRSQALSAARGARPRGARARSAGCAARAGGAARRNAGAGLHAPAARAADRVRASAARARAGLCPRRRPLHRLGPPPRALAAGRGGDGRVGDRRAPGTFGRRARLRRPLREFDRRRGQPRSRRRVHLRRGDDRRPAVAARRRARALVLEAVRLDRARRRVRDRQLDHAAEEESGHRRARARPRGAPHRRSLDDHDAAEGAAVLVQPRPVRRQARGLRCGGFARRSCCRR